MTDTPSTIAIEHRDQVGILSLDRPAALNAMNPAMAGELSAYFAGLPQHPETRVVILRANGRAFCAGAELGSDAFAPAGPGRAQRQLVQQRLYSGLIRLMRACPQPIIALIQGAACGAGFSLALAADVRIAGPRARMNAAYLRVGLGGCDMGSGYLLPRLVGLSAASEFLMTGRFIDADRAKAIGLISAIVDDERLLDEGLALAGDMLRASPLGLRLTKETLNAAIDAPSLDTALTLEDRQQVMLLETADFTEAVAAFEGKRAPHYRDL
ncbi:enoyl-CoA hydratase/isomerase family protein [Oleomonas cavernae]|uniref:Enoyl-CoA hydratase/isomerase family protein n=1 Tax=Oleomonas cavernae TaxID=2320859 RepID=A0A418W8K1_9PROT|nr:enoyl-CoA hydratase-related protein [Oleomonas cavernae]RJF86328.1 enoyl-CoA hydratase/isomerase family protein [Oleomonas cavernae]